MHSITRTGRAASPAFPHRAPAFSAPTPASAVSIARFRAEVPADGVIEAMMPGEEAYVGLIQLRPQPAHQIRLDGRMVPAPASRRGGLNFVDLRAEPMCQLRHPADTLFVHLPRALLDEVAEAAGAPRIEALAVPEPWGTQDRVVAQLTGLLVEAVREAGPAQALLYEHVLIGLAGHFATAYGGLAPGGGLKRGGLAPWQQRRASELLAADLGRDLSLAEVARACGLSPAHFGRAFKVSVGMTPHGWRQRRRIEEAKTLLRGSGLSLAEIAAACGFADQSHFGRVFAQQERVTPGVWRRLRAGMAER